MELASVPRPLAVPVLRVAIPFFLLICFYVSLSVSKHHSFLISTYEFIVVAKSNREIMFFMLTGVSITINIVFGILRPPREDTDHYVRLHELKDYTVLEVSDEDYYYYYQCSDCDEDDNECGKSDGYDEDNDDDGSDDDVNSEDFYGEEITSEELERRAEEFIAKHTRKWREEFVYEKVAYMAAIEFQSSSSIQRKVK